MLLFELNSYGTKTMAIKNTILEKIAKTMSLVSVFLEDGDLFLEMFLYFFFEACTEASEIGNPPFPTLRNFCS